ncbi:MAG: TatD family hydrolase [Anaerolineae bacterium]
MQQLQLIDTHCHLNFGAYNDDLEAVIARAAEHGVTRIINPATDLESGAAALKIAEKYAGVYVAVGIHPNSTAEVTLADLVAVETQAAQPKVVAIGEIGLDYHWDDSPKEQQWRMFEAQLELAARLSLPVIIHNREASDDVLAILERWTATLPESLKDRPGVMHSFSAPREAAERALKIGFYLGFTGPITYKNANDLRLIASRVPLDRLLVETDGPFLTPQQHRGQRNEPAYVAYVNDRLSALHNISIEEMAAQTTRNAERLFAAL